MIVSKRFIRPLTALIAVAFFILTTFGTALPAYALVVAPQTGNGVNVILMIGDGMGWEAARAAVADKVAKGVVPTWYTKGKGKGLSFQNLSGYTFETTYGTTITTAASQDTNTADSNSALDGSSPITGASPIRAGFVFNPALNPGFLAASDVTPGKSCIAGPSTAGNIVGYDPTQGGPNPWTPITPPTPGVDGPLPGVPNYNRNYIKCSYPDSANTATSLYTGHKLTFPVKSEQAANLHKDLAISTNLSKGRCRQPVDRIRSI